MNAEKGSLSDNWIQVISRRVRLVQLLDAAERAGLTPMPLLQLHAFAFLANILSPIWDLEPQDGKLLKRRGGPYYPQLQEDLDRLVGSGVVSLHEVGFKQDVRARWFLEAAYALNEKESRPIIEKAGQFDEDLANMGFLRDLAFALGQLSQDDFDKAMVQDATYSDSRTQPGFVIDFAEWRQENYTANAARRFDKFTPKGARTSPGDKLRLYVRYLERRAHGER